jgi:hypothetical protein
MHSLANGESEDVADLYNVIPGQTTADSMVDFPDGLPCRGPVCLLNLAPTSFPIYGLMVEQPASTNDDMRCQKCFFPPCCPGSTVTRESGASQQERLFARAVSRHLG